jgi:hypothetical protein
MVTDKERFYTIASQAYWELAAAIECGKGKGNGIAKKDLDAVIDAAFALRNIALKQERKVVA